jgi:hypothetical protein
LPDFGKVEKENYTSIYVDKIFGTKLIAEKQPIMSFNFGDRTKEEIFSANCAEDGYRGSIRFSGKGSIEFDSRGKFLLVLAPVGPFTKVDTQEFGSLSQISLIHRGTWNLRDSAKIFSYSKPGFATMIHPNVIQVITP